MILSNRAAEVAIEALAAMLRRAWEEHEAQQKEMDTLRGRVVEQRVMRQEDADTAAKALAAAIQERDEALSKLAQVKGGE